jgi:hypothetical protein
MKVNSGIPIPTENAKRKYPFDQLDIRDSVEFDDTAEFERARRAAQSYGRNHKMRFTARKGIQDGEYVGTGGTIWRVE